MPKYIIKQIPPEQAELAFYFDDDGMTPAAGGLEYALFIVEYDRWNGYKSAINAETWKEITERAADVLEGFADAADGLTDYDGRRITRKRVMLDNGIKYSPTACHRLKAWNEAHEADPTSPEAIAAYLTITTGRPWNVKSAYGYCHGDYAEIVYCEDVYSRKDAETAGEIILGAANEYSITDLDDDGNELNTVCGYIVADCQARRPEDIKKTICAWEGIDPADAVLMIPGDRHTVVTYDYEEVC